MTKVIIVIEGGNVKALHANAQVEYVVVDLDSDSLDPILIGNVNTPDSVDSDLSLRTIDVPEIETIEDFDSHPWAGLPDNEYLPDSFHIDGEDVERTHEEDTRPEMRFTPGPWYISRNGQFIRAGSVRGWNIARIEDQAPYTAANARLIAAAPDLFSATLLLYPLLGGYPEIYNSSQFKMLCEAIDKVIK